MQPTLHAAAAAPACRTSAAAGGGSREAELKAMLERVHAVEGSTSACPPLHQRAIAVRDRLTAARRDLALLEEAELERLSCDVEEVAAAALQHITRLIKREPLLTADELAFQPFAPMSPLQQLAAVATQQPQSTSSWKNAAPTPQPRSLYPPTWPQMACSKLTQLQRRPRLETAGRLENAGGQLAKLFYAVPSTAEQQMQFAYFSEDVSRELYEPLHQLYYEGRRAKRQSVRYQRCWRLFKEPATDKDTTEEGEFVVYESHALPLYLHLIFDGQLSLDTQQKPPKETWASQLRNLFRLIPRDLLVLQIILEQLLLWETAPHIKQPTRLSFVHHLELVCASVRHKMQLSRSQLKDANEKCDLPAKEVLEVWRQLCDSDVCVLPSLSLLDSRQMPDKWLSGLKLLEYHANVTVYPRLEMTAKLLQLAAFKKALEDAPYVPLAEKREDDEAMKTEQEQSHSPMQVTEEQKSTESVVQTESSSAAVKADTDVEMKQAEDDAAEQEEDDSNSSSESEAFNSPIVPVHLGSIEDRIRSCGTVHSFYRKGEYLFATVSDHVSAEEEEEKKSRRELGKAVCVDVIGSEHISFTVHHCQLALPHIIDFSVHLLAQAEKFCGLVSELGIVRVDVDMQVIECEEDEKESELIVTLPDEWKKNWQTTGKGFIVGFRFKNMTKDLDVRWSSLHTNYPILYTAAYATAQELHRLLGDIASKRPLKLHQAPNEEQLHVLKSNQERRDLDALACDEYAQLVKDAKLQSGKWDEILQARQEKEQREKTTVHVREESVLNMYGNVADELKDTGARNSANAHLKEQREEDEKEQEADPDLEAAAADLERARKKAARQAANSRRFEETEMEDDQDEGEAFL